MAALPAVLTQLFPKWWVLLDVKSNQGILTNMPTTIDAFVTPGKEYTLYGFPTEKEASEWLKWNGKRFEEKSLN